jgi:hypothetical protein
MRPGVKNHKLSSPMLGHREDLPVFITFKISLRLFTTYIIIRTNLYLLHTKVCVHSQMKMHALAESIT